jgi:hypothetical protein
VIVSEVAAGSDQSTDEQVIRALQHLIESGAMSEVGA